MVSNKIIAKILLAGIHGKLSKTVDKNDEKPLSPKAYKVWNESQQY